MARPLDVVEDLGAPRLRCAPFRSALGVGSAGTAGAYDAFLCVDVPLPWERDISWSEPFRTLVGEGTTSVRAPDGRTIRPQGLVPVPGTEGRTRVVFHERPASGDGPTVAGPYARREWQVGADEVVDLCRALLQADEAAVAAFAERRVGTPRDLVEVLVCTHGRRDACCGSLGATLHDRLAARLADGPGDGCVRVHRTSHTGGHRFAPTVLTFPDGYAWAHLDEDRALALVRRSVEPSELAPHCRGSAALAGGPAQVADVAVLAELGWDWADAERTATVTAFDRASLATTVRVEGTLPDGTAVVRTAVVEVERHVPQITCGGIDAPEYDVEPVWRVASLDRG